MGAVKLELRCPQIVNGVAADPDPDWKFDSLSSELNALETNLSASSKVPVPFTKAQSRGFSNGKGVERTFKPFLMRVFEDDTNEIESEDDEVHVQNSVGFKRFGCDELYLSDEDESEDEFDLEVQPYLMEESAMVEGALFELTFEYQLGVKEEIRDKISALETDMISGDEKSTSALLRVEKYREARRETERKLDTQYQRKIAVALDNHLTAIQRDHELKSQIEERKIRSDAAIIEGRRKEKALQEEKLRQEKAKAEAEAKLRAEEVKRAALEAQIRAEKEAVEREAIEASKRDAAKVVQKDTSGNQTNASLGTLSAETTESEFDKKKSVPAGNIIKAAEGALKLEQDRFKKLTELDEGNKAFVLNLNKDYSRHERNISKLIRQITGTRDVVSQKAFELVNLLQSPVFPQSASIGSFARKVVSNCESPGSASFACSYVIVIVTSKVPDLMDIILAELNKACIYTVPKHLVYSQSAFESKEAYYKTLGFREEQGKIENVEDYLIRLESYMKLYGALVQTEIDGFQNLHGLKEGWAWIARFLNALPANRFTAVALNSFLRMAGYALFKKYKSQFRKILNIVSDNFLNALNARKDPTLNSVIAEIQSYIEDSKFLEEPEGRSLETSLLSSIMVPESDYQDSYHRGGYYY